MLGLVVLWLILALMSLALLVYLRELLSGRSCDDNDTTPPARVRLSAVLPVGVLLLILAAVSRMLLDVTPGSAADSGFAVVSGVGVAGVVAGLLARAWLSRRDAERVPEHSA
jgi:hypothetical protein